MEEETRRPIELLKEWRDNPLREVWVIDETKDALPLEQKHHGELVVFSTIRTRADKACSLLEDAKAARQKLRGGQASMSFKSGKLWNAFQANQEDGSKVPLARFVGTIADSLVQCHHVIQVVTTQRHIAESPLATMISLGRNLKIVNSSKQLNIMRNLLRRLVLEWEPTRGPIDVVIDRSMAFGLDPSRENINPDVFRMHYGKLHSEDPFEFRIIAGSDTEATLRDLLLLPDFFGYLVRHHRVANLGHAIPEVLSGEIPFYLVPYDLPAMIAAVKAGENVPTSTS